ncbi:saccharopine dehydrogenase family protein [Denitratisoma oestradiolicum]|uniref:Saccharopine dehydrogenase (NAD+, L-lysine forming) n=1 Tax=Denitratisoma oestradiolicum TaxID=311182 RepID=A0A6S6YLK1_9PROT|nr:saccharopine dehydrogenase NADP-binding domain-containing protein [Denitratisoma oestradiolicum]TWO81406.1 hypothetical protein CBW56_04660 [Denitratisoma oestradiolicum]CAB1368604.1 Saccharopine dehydrogenase (NAD+, L-lysine forming) [Denitratisoma oestradiolicum]
MMRILTLGCGGVGANATKQMAARHPEIEYVVADLNIDTAQHLAHDLAGCARPLRVDVHDRQSLNVACEGVDLIFNAAGPYYRNAAPVIDMAIEKRIDYIDVNDDHDVAENLFGDSEFMARVAAAGIRMVVGCGFAPGMTNVMARYAADRLDRVEAIRLALAVPFVPTLFTPAILEHMFHITAGTVTQVIDGIRQQVPGWSGERIVQFAEPFGAYPAYYFGHGETVTLAHFMPGVKEVSNRLAFMPKSGSDKWRTLIEQGFASTSPLDDLGFSPARYIAHHMKSVSAKAYFSPDLSTGPNGYSNQVEVEGFRNGDRVSITCEVHGSMSEERFEKGKRSLELDTTPTCARIGMEAFLRNEVQGQGLLAPEVSFEPEAFIREVLEASQLTMHMKETIIRCDLRQISTSG